MNNTHKYDDIIELTHHISKKHPQMAMIDRAAQFSPFAALTGYDAAIRETGRLTDRFVELDDNCKAVLDETLQTMREHLSEQPKVWITYFQPDERKNGGEYVQIYGNLKRIDEQGRMLVMADGRKIEMDRIIEMVDDVKTILDDKDGIESF